MKPNIAAALAAFTLVAAGAARADPVNIVAYDPTGHQVIDFEDLAASPFPGVVYDSIFHTGGASFAERFVGQTVTASGGDDVLAGSPSGALTLQVGAASQNLDLGTDNGTHNLIPCGGLGCSDPDGYGEGAFALKFDNPTAYFGLQQFFADGGGITTLDFFNSAGGLIQEITVDAGGTFGFLRAGGVADIAGVSVFTSDPGGLGYDNLLHDTATHGDPGVPEPSVWAMLIMGFGMVGAMARRRAAPIRA